MNYRSKALLFDPAFQKEIDKTPLCYVDIGASGSMGRPWHDLVNSGAPIRTIGFEPDPDECARLNDRAPSGSRFLPVALWNQEGDISFNICGDISMSSVNPPNHPFIQKYEARNWSRRVTERTVRMKASTLDSILAKESFDADFVKCDTQGSEYEILEGAIRSLTSDVLGVVAETWSVEVHNGQALSFGVEKLMHDCGFTPVVREVHGRWRRRSAQGLREIPQETSYDILFLRREEELFAARPSKEKILKLAAIADVFGATGYALDILELAKNGHESAVFDDIQTKILARRRTNGRLDRLKSETANRVFRKLGFEWRDFAPLGG